MQNGVRHVLCLGMMAFDERVHLAEREDWRAQREAGKRLAEFENVRPRAETRVHLEDHVFAQWINGRVGDLRESLPEERVERAGGAGEWGNRCVVAHRPDGVFAIGQELPHPATIVTNDPRITYFSGRPYDEIRNWTWSPKAPPTDAEMADIDYFVFDVTGPDELPPKLADLTAKELVRSFPGKDGRTVLIYRQMRPAKPAGG